ncbi:MAG: hypothetical protein RIE06_04610 [Roseibium album]|uniref:hypothetical protein n=1 Tax=Roseibium album TaxID=311410 RepID=UPI0018CA8449|nr:hypothetical protein [Roseibium album]MBG6147345.1 hypothetical protein [Labrenzia sp. EL_142]MBG6159927.1 hypothetical protein [Labrenzia sp. EL_162]MBG6178030.1 hypothetical protein [Labrenzia sp. EL_132]MBG6198459.1 hypothetical protein [Labrenzia sp. EL_159]MBG6210656.1 hypothetical protein [Labrenzia sp. EL_126]MBG6232653.1 hypothetical protein [Labrenzia sp. EL_208]
MTDIANFERLEDMMRYEDNIDAAVLALETARQLLSDEIRDYPTPVSGCDAQYNHLLSKRTQITKALSVLQTDVFVPTPRTLVEGSGVESR